MAGIFEAGFYFILFVSFLALIAGALFLLRKFIWHLKEKQFLDMGDPIKIALILAAAIIGTAAILIYFSPYHTCVRSQKDSPSAEIRCLAISR